MTVESVVQDPTTGAVTVTLSRPLIRNLVSQPGETYAYTFGTPEIGIIRDPGFEWGTVQGLTGGFNHGFSFRRTRWIGPSRTRQPLGSRDRVQQHE